MKYFDFNPFGTQAIIAKFECDQCGHQVESEEVGVPSPNYMADNASDSQTENEGHAICENCEKQYDIDIYVTYGGASGHISELPDGNHVEIEEIDEPYYEDQYEAISANTEFLDTLNRDLDELTSLLNVLLNDTQLEKIFNRQLYASTIGTLETYLSDAFINTVLSNEGNLKVFFKTFKSFEKQNIAMSAIYEFHEKADSIAKKIMLDVIYHNLPKVSKMYKDTLGIIFPQFGEIYKSVLIRHDLVHRNGKTKEGDEVLINKEAVTELIGNVRLFVCDIDEQLHARG